MPVMGRRDTGPMETPHRSDLAGTTALVTGASSGIGRVTARELACRGATVVLACRSEARTQPVLAEIARLTGRADAAVWLPLDLADFASVRACAEGFLRLERPLHLLVNNAGLAGARGLTRDGFEMAFGVNHLGHFLLTRCLEDRLITSAPARVVTVASRAHRGAGGLDWAALRRPTRSLTGIREYAASKLANILFSAALARRLADRGVGAYAVHPGVVDTEVWRTVPGALRPLLRLRGLLTPEDGARTSLHCCVDALPGESGLYFARSSPVTPSRRARDGALADELWQRSEAWVAG